MTVELHVFLDQNDAPSATELVKFDLVYNAVAPSETYDKASTTISATYTLTASDVEKDHVTLSGTIDYDDATNPLAVGDEVLMSIDLDEGAANDYDGDPILCIFHVQYNSTSLPSN